jgi:hypothetical protein
MKHPATAVSTPLVVSWVAKTLTAPAKTSSTPPTRKSTPPLSEKAITNRITITISDASMAKLEIGGERRSLNPRLPHRHEL